MNFKNNTNDIKRIQRQLGAMHGTLADKEREYAIGSTSTIPSGPQAADTFWGLTADEWMDLTPLPHNLMICQHQPTQRLPLKGSA